MKNKTMEKENISFDKIEQNGHGQIADQGKYSSD